MTIVNDFSIDPLITNLPDTNNKTYIQNVKENLKNIITKNEKLRGDDIQNRVEYSKYLSLPKSKQDLKNRLNNETKKISPEEALNFLLEQTLTDF